MNNKTYDYLKWIALIVLPSLGTLVGTVGLAVAWEHTELAVVVITAVGTFLGTTLGVSTAKYNKTED